MVVQMNSSSRLVGLRFMPLSSAGLGASWKPPAYATVGSCREEQLRIGSKYSVGGTLSLPQVAAQYSCDMFLLVWILRYRDSSAVRLEYVR